VCVEAPPGRATSVTFRAWHRACASLAISGLGRACSAARAGTGRTERSLASATAEQRRRGCGPAHRSQTTLSTRTNLRMCSFRISLRCAAQRVAFVQMRVDPRDLGAASSAVARSWRFQPAPSDRMLWRLVQSRPQFDSTEVDRRHVLVWVAHT
jgi:hypothetical protein